MSFYYINHCDIIAHSVVKKRLDTDTAFSKATRRTLAGSMTPCLNRFPYVYFLAL